MSDYCIIHLGRTGDIVSTIPIAYDLHKKGHNVDWYVHEHFASILEPCSYINPIIWKQLHRNVDDAVRVAKESKKYDLDKIWPLQFDGNSLPLPVNVENFIESQWSRAGQYYLDNFHNIPLIFDRRDKEAEEKEISRWIPKEDGRPLLVYSLSSWSSGITLSGESRPYWNKIIATYPQWLKGFTNYRLLNIGLEGQPSSEGFKLSSPKYLIPILEKADILLSVDSLPIHLAYATKTPTIVLSVKHKWYQSEPRVHWIDRLTYEEAITQGGMKRIEEILGRDMKKNKYVTGKLIRDVSKNNVRKILHGVSWYDGGETVNYRVLKARQSWENLRVADRYYNIEFIEDNQLKRSALDIGDIAKLPYIKDLFNILSNKVNNNDIILFTNSDIFLTSDALDIIRKKMESVPCCFTFRRDVPNLPKYYKSAELSTFKPYCGSDLFCFTKDWWLENKDIFPDLLLGREGWDWLFRRMCLYEYPNAEIKEPISYHISHITYWCRLPFIVENPGQKHNRGLCKEWALKNKFDKHLNNNPQGPLFKMDSQVK